MCYEEVVLVIRHKELVIGRVDTNCQIILFSIFRSIYISCFLSRSDSILIFSHKIRISFQSEGQKRSRDRKSGGFFNILEIFILENSYFHHDFFTYDKKKPRSTSKK